MVGPGHRADSPGRPGDGVDALDRSAGARTSTPCTLRGGSKRPGGRALAHCPPASRTDGGGLMDRPPAGTSLGDRAVQPTGPDPGRKTVRMRGTRPSLASGGDFEPRLRPARIRRAVRTWSVVQAALEGGSGPAGSTACAMPEPRRQRASRPPRSPWHRGGSGSHGIASSCLKRLSYPRSFRTTAEYSLGGNAFLTSCASSYDSRTSLCRRAESTCLHRSS